QIELPKDVSISQTNQLTRQAEDFLTGKKEVVSLITTVGQSSSGGIASLSPAYQAEITVKLVDKKNREESADMYAARMKQELEKLLVGAKVQTMPINIIGMAQRAPVEMIVTGSDLDSVTQYANEVL